MVAQKYVQQHLRSWIKSRMTEEYSVNEGALSSFPHVVSGNLVGEEIPDQSDGPEKHSGMTQGVEQFIHSIVILTKAEASVRQSLR
ncbi:hypothetical protein A1QG_13645 [Vibrio breoganii ZF-29]|nr:hypothetical protein A1QG_13645 [Vibrio breoganii ZF-29]OEF81399.1 hypothetical protein B003_12515 [Vibrio breoganii 1C10]PMG97542.1 hypothetical protein BCU80_18600 [Vibrio breoganii]